MLWIEPISRTVGIGLRHATLSAREWSLLMLLLDADQQPVASSVIEEKIWGEVGRQSTLASVVSRLRDRLQAHRLPAIEILTVRGSGYAVRLYDVDTSLLRQSPDNTFRL
jgi:DNA-binding response OmpR family regulator